jgi:hypothetical protein
MGGFICKREILSHPITIIRAFGFSVFFRCLTAKENTPFLTILMKAGKI